MEALWYQDVAYEDAKELVKENLVSTVAAFIASGYWLKYIRDRREYEKDGYQTLWECAEQEFGLKISEASRAMSMNDKYSTDGNTPFMSESYKQYNKSQLQEMLTMTDEQIERVTPDMTIKDIREIKNPKQEDSEENGKKLEELRNFMHVYVQTEYVKLSRFFPVAADIGIERLKAAYDEKSPRSSEIYTILMFGDKDVEMVDPETGEILAKYDADTVIEVFSEEYAWVCDRKACKIMPKVKGLMNDPYCAVCGTPLNSPNVENTSDRCSWCGQAVEWTEYIKQYCDVATDLVNTECEDESEPDIYVEIEADSEEEPLNVEFDTEELLQELDDSSDDGQRVVDAEYREVGKPELPKLTNNKQRRAWLEDVEAWGLWYEDGNIQARYYKYDFADGSRLIAVKYRYTCPPWLIQDKQYKEADGSYKDAHYHMIYSEEYKKNHKYEYENYYVHSTVSISTLIDFIKEISKRGNESE